MLLIPCFKAVLMFFLMISLLCCYSESFTAFNLQRYVLMLLVAAETVSRTAIGCFFYLIANGWGVLCFDFDPLQATNCAKFLGIAYICHSSYFVTFGATTVHTYIRVSINCSAWKND